MEMYSDKDESIIVNDNECEIHFNSSITPKSMSTLIDKLLKLQDKILTREKKQNVNFQI